MKELKKEINKNIVISIIIFLLGLIIFLKPDTTIKSIAIIIGIILIIMGSGPILELIKNKERKITFSLAPSIILFVMAFILFFSPELLVSIIPLLIGIVLIMTSSFKLQKIYNLKKNNNIFNIWTLIITMSILILGLLLIINPFKGALAITKIIGVFLIVYSVLDVIDGFILRKITKENNEN